MTTEVPMTAEVTVPELGESIYDVRIARWFKQEGDEVRLDEDLAEIESEKATVVLPAPQTGRLVQVLVAGGQDAKVGQVIGRIEAAGGAKKSKDQPPQTTSDTTGLHTAGKAARGESSPAKSHDTKPETGANASDSPTAPPQAEPAAAHDHPPLAAGPDARRALREFGLSEEEVAAEVGEGKRWTREDVRQYASRQPGSKSQEIAIPPAAKLVDNGRREEVTPMSPLRRRIAERLVLAQQQAALLTTFNEIDMSAVMALRKKYGERFEQQHDVRLGFMSFFVSAAVESLRQCPALNAEVRGTDIVLKKYYDIGIAVGTERGLVVPVVRSADRLSLAEIEAQIGNLARRARAGHLVPADLTGGTFTITNGGIYGSMLSTPIVNPPQTGILGLHAIQDRPAAVDGQVVVRPMMFAALTYDHRVVDGAEAVTFLRGIKERIEDPMRMFIDV